jgi:hypothetical protein
MKETNLQKYGVENTFQVEEFKQKSKQTCMQVYGVEHPIQSEEIKNKVKETNIEKYGTICPIQNEKIQNKIIESNLEKYGVEYVLQSPEIREKIKQTCVEKYGVPYPNQNTDMMEKSSKSAYKLKNYIYPSGREIKYQGYENFALDEIVKLYDENDIITGSKNVPEIWYNDSENKKHRHYVDIFIPSENKCIEVKSTWTLKKKKDNILEKQKYAKELGFNYEIWVYDKNGVKIELIE